MKNRQKFIGIGSLVISRKARKYINEALDNNRLSYGPFAQKFEKLFAQIHHRKYALFCNSGTSALQVGLHALKKKYGWKDGDEILVPAVTFIASSNVIIQNNLKPVFVDIEPDYYEIDPDKIAGKITKKTRAIMPVHLFGQPCDMFPIMKIAKRYVLKVIEDSCEAMFAKYKGEVVGSWGDVACFSTYISHLIITGVGGITATNNDDLAVSIKSLFNHGRDGIYISIDDDNNLKDYSNFFKIVNRRFSFVDVGYSYRATELEAALGLANLEVYKSNIKRRIANAKYLIKGLSDLSEYLELPKTREDSEHVFMLFPLVLRSPEVERDMLIRHLEINGIETRYMMPLLNQPIYRELFGDIEDQYPVAKKINERGFIIGCHPLLTKSDLNYVINCFHEFFKKGNTFEKLW